MSGQQNRAEMAGQRVSIAPPAWMPSPIRRRDDYEPRFRATAPVAIATDGLYVVWELWRLHNAERIKAGLPEFKLDGRLWRVSRDFAAELASTGVLTHNRRSGVPFYSQIWASLGAQVPCSENAAEGQTTTQQVIAAWMASPGHRANILGPYDTWGGAMAATANGVKFWSADFCQIGPQNRVISS